MSLRRRDPARHAAAASASPDGGERSLRFGIRSIIQKGSEKVVLSWPMGFEGTVNGSSGNKTSLIP